MHTEELVRVHQNANLNWGMTQRQKQKKNIFATEHHSPKTETLFCGEISWFHKVYFFKHYCWLKYHIEHKNIIMPQWNQLTVK